jgi:hypothetical protein
MDGSFSIKITRFSRKTMTEVYYFTQTTMVAKLA